LTPPQRANSNILRLQSTFLNPIFLSQERCVSTGAKILAFLSLVQKGNDGYKKGYSLITILM